MLHAFVSDVVQITSEAELDNGACGEGKKQKEPQGPRQAYAKHRERNDIEASRLSWSQAPQPLLLRPPQTQRPAYRLR